MITVVGVVVTSVDVKVSNMTLGVAAGIMVIKGADVTLATVEGVATVATVDGRAVDVIVAIEGVAVCVVIRRAVSLIIRVRVRNFSMFMVVDIRILREV